MRQPGTPEEYLGDGLYVSIVNGPMIMLRAPGRAAGPDGNHIVFLEPGVWRELLRWAATQGEGWRP